MNKMSIYILFFVSIVMGSVIWFISYGKSPEPISKQIDMKTWKANIDWIYSTSYWPCVWTCRNYSSSSSSSSRWWGSFGGK